jgi:hypothetical protein
MISRSSHLVKAISASPARRKLLIVAGVAIVLLACGSTGTVNIQATNTPAFGGTPATNPSPIGTNTPGPPATCATLLPGAGTATAGSHFTDVTFPANSVSTPIALQSSGTGQWSIYTFNVCSPNYTAVAVRAFFAAQLPAHSWAQSPTLPFNGSYQAPCGDPYCWMKDAAPRYVGLEKVIDAGNNNVTYRIRLFIPPPLPQCPVGPFHGPGGPFDTWMLSSSVGVPAPPLAEHGPSSGFDQNGYAQDPDPSLCAAGNASSLTAYFNYVMPLLGWAHGSVPGGCLVGSKGTIWRKGPNMIAIDVSIGTAYTNAWAFGYTDCIHL